MSFLPEIMQSLSIGLITVTVAVAIFLAEKGTVFFFDRIVILKKVIQAKTFIIFFMLLFLPLFFWGFSNNNLKILLLIIYSIAVTGFINFLKRSYKWIAEIKTKEKRDKNGYRQRKRLEYLEEVESGRHKLLIWEYIWQLDNKSGEEERDYINKFMENINFFIEQDSEKDATNYLSSFERLIDNVNLRDRFIFKTVINKILNWHYKLFKKYKENEEDRNRYVHLLTILERLIGLFIEKGLKVEISYTLFERLKIFIDKNDNNKEYLKKIISIVSFKLFENISDSPEKHSIWLNYFPNEWKITKPNIEEENNYLVNLWFNYFLQWAKPRMWRHMDKDAGWDEKLENVIEGLFPNVDPPVWSIILTFLMRPWGNNNRMKDLVEIPRKFGFASRISMSYDVSEDGRQKTFNELNEKRFNERENALELALVLFRKIFTKSNLRDYISELENLSYENNSQEDKERDRIKKIFKDMLEKLE